MKKPTSITKALYSSFTGLSPLLASEICHRSSIDGDMSVDSLDDDGKKHLFNNLTWIAEDVKNHTYKPNIIFKGKEPIDFSCIELTQFSDYEAKNFDSISQVLEEYYASKNVYTRIRQKSVDLRKIVSTALDRNRKKYQLQEKQLKDTEKRDKYKVVDPHLRLWFRGRCKEVRGTELLHQRDDHHSARLSVRRQGKRAEIF